MMCVYVLEAIAPNCLLEDSAGKLDAMAPAFNHEDSAVKHTVRRSLWAPSLKTLWEEDQEIDSSVHPSCAIIEDRDICGYFYERTEAASLNIQTWHGNGNMVMALSGARHGDGNVKRYQCCRPVSLCCCECEEVFCALHGRRSVSLCVDCIAFKAVGL